MNVISMRIRTLLVIGVLAAAVTGAVGQTTLAIPDTTGKRPDTLLVPITLGGLGGNQVFSFQATVDFDANDVRVLGVVTTGTLSVGGTASYFETTRRLALALTTPVATDGVLLYLSVALTGTPGQQTPLGLSSVLMNEGTPTATVDPGSVRLRVVHISPAYPGVIAEGDSLQFGVSGDVVMPVGWSTSSSSVGTIDAGGMFHGVAPGFLTVYVTDGEGKTDSTAQFNVAPSVLKSLTLWIPDTSRTQMLEVAIPVRVTTVTGLGISSAQFRLTYNVSHLQFLGIDVAGGMTESWAAPTVNDLTPGTLDFALAGSDTLTGEGTLLWVRFRVRQSASGSSTVGLANAMFNEVIAPALDPGTFTVIPAPFISVNIDRTIVYKGGNVVVQSLTGGTTPFTFASSNPSVATVNASTGELTALNRGPVLILATDALGFPGKSDTIRTYDFPAVIADTSMRQTDSVDVPLTIGDAAGLGITSYEFRVGYDTAKVRFRGLILSGTLSDGYTEVVKDSASVIRAAVAGVTPLSGQGVLVKLRFAPNPLSPGNEVSPLPLTSITFNEPGATTPQAHPVSGSVRIIIPNAVPAFTHVLPDTTLDEGSIVTIAYTATDANGDPLRFFLKLGPAGATVDSVSGLFTWAIGYADAGSHTLTVGVHDGEDTVLAMATVTVMNVNRPPVFSSELSSQTMSAGQAVNFTYVAVDPDSQPVRYQFVTAPAAATLDSVSGAFAWTIQPADSGANVIRVIATDGDLADTTAATITVPGATSGVDDAGEIPSAYALGQNYPNPFNPSTSILFSLPVECRVTLIIHDQLGREVTRLADRSYGAGVHQVSWNAEAMASGLYLFRIEAIGSNGQRFVQTNKMMLMK